MKFLFNLFEPRYTKWIPIYTGTYIGNHYIVLGRRHLKTNLLSFKKVMISSDIHYDLNVELDKVFKQLYY